jgi:Tfp pilus assembly protein PilN
MSRFALRPPARWRRRGPAEINLAARPFVNERPVRRAALLLLVGGLLLAAANGWIYSRYVLQRTASAGELERVEAAIESEERQVARLAAELAAADLTQQNRLVEFLNQRIAERTFGWSVLFDRLEDLLPRDVRLVSLTPREAEGSQPRRARPGERGGAAGGEQRFDLALVGVAREPEAVLELIDALFADAAFHDPDLHQESFRAGEVQFTLDVGYLPAVAEALVDAAGAPAADAGAAPAPPAAGAGVLTPGAAAAEREETR